MVVKMPVISAAKMYPFSSLLAPKSTTASVRTSGIIVNGFPVPWTCMTPPQL